MIIKSFYNSGRISRKAIEIDVFLGVKTFN